MSKIEEFFEKAVAAGIIPQIPMNYDAVCYKIYTGYLENKIDELAAENAELRARLECSIEFPCKVGDTIYFINPYKEQPKIDEFKVTSLCKDNSYGKMIYIDNGEFFFAKTDGLFFTRAEAEARLKELKGKMVYTVIKNCTNCQHYDVGWAECTAPATANFDCESTHRT